MSIASLSAVTNRIGQIQSRIDRIAPQRATFDHALQVARAKVGEADTEGATLVAAQATPRSGWFNSAGTIPIGMMGTPVLLNGDIGAASFLSDSGKNWVDALPAAGRAWAPAIRDAANEAGVDPRLFAAVVWQESGFEATAVSRSGAVGLSQLMPATAQGLGVDPIDPVENLEGGARYLAWTIREFGSVELGLAAYNAGPTRVREADGIPAIPETQAYVPRVVDYYRQLGGTA